MTITTGFRLLKRCTDLHVAVAILLAVPVLYYHGMKAILLVAGVYL